MLRKPNGDSGDIDLLLSRWTQYTARSYNYHQLIPPGILNMHATAMLFGKSLIVCLGLILYSWV